MDEIIIKNVLIKKIITESIRRIAKQKFGVAPIIRLNDDIKIATAGTATTIHLNCDAIIPNQFLEKVFDIT